MNVNNINPFLNDINQNVQPINQDRRPENIDNSQTSTAINIQKAANTDQNQLENQLKDSIKNAEELKKILQELQNKISYLNKSLKIELNEEIKEPVVKIIDITSNEVIRQIPPDYVINIIKNINKMLGALVNEKV
ncbi:MAG TPA: flagellar biosynthesis protein FlaG [Sulfurihydrogenibium sp.]|uniref:flagellar protein FlaG n=1 Tax=Sulfurihydrogenibium sp. (strain YO3AOP1) TaxID=436114 RepID=UPI0001724F79|nr:flagellar protein FlaG [Sulfurihydrogenibium sp. YO3AOP1]ACD66612.1 flagellar protein FlaG protein [Sulfurihydrogenibium sp. YO3AOP1]HBT98378.1 flagellar biosynthesis protein FlaG [Sulfurihydrogenibium sp.]